ncbi:MAG: Peptide-methionine (S)-S-oxide reductase [Vezdaea acicularis]|nr:MAG: Peptide-methionine (S)-S-oxide reductase [Vezdaea acicularis]
MPLFLTRLFRPFSMSSRPMAFTPESNGASAGPNFPDGAQKATVAAGCFWGVEHMYRRYFGAGKGLLDARVGYIGGDMKDPGYRAVCTGKTGHAEALQVVFDPSIVTYRQLLEFFYKMHDPTTKDAQGPDRGSQYRSAIFYHDEEQGNIAKEVTAKVAKEWWKTGTVTTDVAPAGEWYDAETYHQKYLDENPGGYECPSHYLRAFPKLSE